MSKAVAVDVIKAVNWKHIKQQHGVDKKPNDRFFDEVYLIFLSVRTNVTIRVYSGPGHILRKILDENEWHIRLFIIRLGI